MRHISNTAMLSILGLVVLFPSLSPADSANSINKPQAITATGECLIKVIQDRGRVSLGSTSVARTPKEASEQAIRAHEAIKSRVKALDLKDYVSNTASYQVFEECTYNQGQRSCQGYRARISTQFETSEISRLGDVISIGATLSSENISNLETFASPELLKRSREDCLEVATKNAAVKAHKLAQGAGVRLGTPISIQESNAGAGFLPLHPNYRTRMMADSESASSSPSIDSRPIDLQVAVIVSYSFE